MTLAEDLKRRVAASIANDSDPPHVIAWLICRYAYALGYAKGLEAGRAFPNDEDFAPIQSGLWHAGYAFEELSPIPIPTVTKV